MWRYKILVIVATGLVTLPINGNTPGPWIKICGVMGGFVFGCAKFVIVVITGNVSP
jgi:hypothetical protein